MLNNSFPEGGINNTLWYGVKLLLHHAGIDNTNQEYIELHATIKALHKRDFNANGLEPQHVNLYDGDFKEGDIAIVPQMVNKYLRNHKVRRFSDGKEGYHPPIHDFSITDLDGNDITNEVLSDSSYSFLLISYKINKADLDGIISATKFASENKNYKFYFLTASLNKDIEFLQDTLLKIFANDSSFISVNKSQTEIIYYYEKDGEILDFTADNLPDDTWQYIYEEEVESNNSSIETTLPFKFYITDEITLKTVIRSNPGLVLIQNGTIINKWAFLDFPQNINEIDL
jgi:hypothetical protein